MSDDNAPMSATAFLRTAAETLAERGKARDQAGERSMVRAVELYNAMTVDAMTCMSEEQGWLFMIALKLARAERSHDRDHYIDLIGYSALLAECVDEGGRE